MAKIWMAKDGREPTRGGPLAVLPVEYCKAKLRLNPDGFLKGPSRPEETHAGPRFGNQEDAVAPFADPRHVVIELQNDEANKHGWKPGFYLAEVSVIEAERILRSDGHIT
jgi:hypothetical protein